MNSLALKVHGAQPPSKSLQDNCSRPWLSNLRTTTTCSIFYSFLKQQQQQQLFKRAVFVLYGLVNTESIGEIYSCNEFLRRARKWQAATFHSVSICSVIKPRLPAWNTMRTELQQGCRPELLFCLFQEIWILFLHCGLLALTHFSLYSPSSSPSSSSSSVIHQQCQGTLLQQSMAMLYVRYGIHPQVAVQTPSPLPSPLPTSHRSIRPS